VQLEGYVEALREDLIRVAAVGDEATVRAAELLAVALESAFGRRLQEALAEAALELSGRLERGRVEVRIAAGEPELVYVEEAASEPLTLDAGDGAFDARITLRLPESLKARLEAAAAAAGVSVNTWLVQALGRQVAQGAPGGVRRHRLTGYGRS
jgi:HicB family